MRHFSIGPTALEFMQDATVAQHRSGASSRRPSTRRWRTPPRCWRLLRAATLCLAALVAAVPLRAQTAPVEHPPTMQYGVIVGGDNVEEVVDSAVDAAGNLYILGLTRSADFPTARPAQPRFGGGNCIELNNKTCNDAFVVSLDPSGQTMRYSTFFGGSGNEQPSAIAVDSRGTVYLTGTTSSTDLPIAGPQSGALQQTLHGPSDAFLAMLSPAGELVSSGYLGGSATDRAYGLALSPDGSLWLAGVTTSPDFPLAAPLQPGFAGGVDGDAFVSQISADTSQLRFSTYLGGSQTDWATAITIGGDGAIYLTGGTESRDFPLLQPIQRELGESDRNAPFVASLRPDGSALRFSTYFGGSRTSEIGGAIAVSADGDLLVGIKTYQGGSVARLSGGGQTLVYRSYVGYPGDVAFDAAGNAYTAITPWPNKSRFNLPKGAAELPCSLYTPHVVMLDGDGAVSATFMAPYALNTLSLGADGRLFLAGDSSLVAQRIDPPNVRLGAGSDHMDDSDAYMLALNAGPGQRAWQWPPPPYANQTTSQFGELWAKTDKLLAVGSPSPHRPWLWGEEPLTGVFCEQAQGTPGDTRNTQYFDKGRMELNMDDQLPINFWVTSGLLVVELISGQVQLGTTTFEPRAPAQEAVAGDPVEGNPTAPTYRDLGSVAWPVTTTPARPARGSLVTAVLDAGGGVREEPALASYAVRLGPYHAQFGHNIAQVFAAFLARQDLFGADWQALIGAPLSEPYWVKAQVGGVGRDVLVQPFERRILTYTPANPPEWRIELGNVGRHYLRWRYQIAP